MTHRSASIANAVVSKNIFLFSLLLLLFNFCLAFGSVIRRIYSCLTYILITLQGNVDQLSNLTLSNMLAQTAHSQCGERKYLIIVGFVMLEQGQKVVLVHEVFWIFTQGTYSIEKRKQNVRKFNKYQYSL